MTYILLLVAGVVAICVGLVLRRKSWQLGQGLLILGCVVSLCGVGWQVRQNLFPPEPRVLSRAHAVVSFRFASQLQTELAGRAGQIVLILPARLDSGSVETYAGAFSAPLLRGHPEWNVEVIQLAGADARAFAKAVAKQSNALAYVSFAGVPKNFEGLSPAQPATKPFLVYDPEGSCNWLGALKKGQIHSVIVPRPDVDQAAMAGVAGLPGELFGQLYLLATPANADQVAARLTANQ